MSDVIKSGTPSNVSKNYQLNSLGVEKGTKMKNNAFSKVQNLMKKFEAKDEKKDKKMIKEEVKKQAPKSKGKKK